MFGGHQPQGFTIVEIMIFLAVSALLFLSVIGLIEQKYNSTEFFTTEHNLFGEMQGLAEGIQNGSYSTSNNFRCHEISGVPHLYGGSNPQGTNYGCTYIGEVLGFSWKHNASNISVVSVVGSQFNASGGLTTNLTQANSIPLDVSVNANSFPGGFKFISAKFFNPTTSQWQYTPEIGFFTAFPSDGVGGTVNSGSDDVELIPIPTFSGTQSSTSGTLLPANQNTDLSYLYQLQNNGGSNGNVVSTNAGCVGGAPTCTYINPPSGVIICLQYPDLSNRYAVIQFGGTSSNGNNSGNPLGSQLKTTTSCP